MISFSSLCSQLFRFISVYIHRGLAYDLQLTTSLTFFPVIILLLQPSKQSKHHTSKSTHDLQEAVKTFQSQKTLNFSRIFPLHVYNFKFLVYQHYCHMYKMLRNVTFRLNLKIFVLKSKELTCSSFATFRTLSKTSLNFL